MRGKKVRMSVGFDSKLRTATFVLMVIIAALVLVSYTSMGIGHTKVFRFITGGLMMVMSAIYIYLARSLSRGGREFKMQLIYALISFGFGLAYFL